MFVVLAGLFLWGLSQDMCANFPIRSVLSPDRQLRVQVFERDCGATTDVSTQATILDADQPLPNEAGDLFVAATAMRVDVSWVAPDKVIIGHEAGVALRRQAQQLRGIDVEYVVEGNGGG